MGRSTFSELEACLVAVHLSRSAALHADRAALLLRLPQLLIKHEWAEFQPEPFLGSGLPFRRTLE